MPTYEIVQLIEVGYSIEAEDEDIAYQVAMTMDWDVNPWGVVEDAEVGDLNPCPGGSILSMSEYPD